MAVNVNLIPQQVVPKGYQDKIIRSLKFLNFFLVLVFIVAAIGLVMIISTNKIRLSSAQKKYDSTLSEFDKMKDLEQKYVLLSNRVNTIKSSIQDKDILGDFNNFYETSMKFPDGSFVQNFQIEKGKAEISLGVDTTDRLPSTLATVLALGSYNNVILENFTFSPSNGYNLKIVLTQNTGSIQ